MDELDYYSADEIEDMELPDWEVLGKSDFELIEELATVCAINEYEMDPHLDEDKQTALAEVERRGLLMDDDWECEECRDRNSVDCEWCQGCGARRGMPF